MPVEDLTYTWKVASHELGTKTTMSEQDAIAAHGRELAITASGYTTPWHGRCAEAKRERSRASLVEVTADVDVTPDGRARLKQFGIAVDPIEYRLVCQGRTTAPLLTIWVTGKRAMTCFGGVCYLLTRSS